MIHQSKLSADPTVLILGIVSLCILLFTCLCGLMVPVSLTLAIVGWVLAHKSLKEYHSNPEAFSQSSRSIVNTAKIICIVSTLLNGLIVIVFIIGICFLKSDIFERYLDKEVEKRSNAVSLFNSNVPKNETLIEATLYKENCKDTFWEDTISVKI